MIQMIAADLAPELRERPWNTPGEMAQALDRGTIQTPALDVIDEHLAKVATGEIERFMCSMPPQEGKSLRISVWFVVWLLHRNPNLRVAIVCNGFELAQTFGEQIRDILRDHPELGLTLSKSTAKKHEFKLLGYKGGVVCVGIEGSLTGKPVDVLIIDDPYKDEKQADSKAWRQTVQRFWQSVALTRLAPGAPVVIVQTRWRKDDLSGWLRAEYPEEWTALNIAAQAIDSTKLPEDDPDYGKPDPLGREPGEFMESARRRTLRDWAKKMREVGSRVWIALYQGRPSPVEGGILKRDWWQRYDQPLWFEREDGARLVTGFDEVLMSWDMAFKDTEDSDYVVGQVWGRRGVDAYLLEQVRGRWDFVETCNQFEQLAARWPQALLKLVEDKANGTAVIASLRKRIAGIVPEEPHGSKEARASAVSPLVEAGNVYLPAPAIAPWVGGLIEECAGFPTATNDDQVDALSQGLNRLVLQPFLAGEIVDEDDLDDDLADFQISAY
ncbi:phage terminase large subunit [Nocardioides sp. MAH-18]|uniref:Phage terminase large subunit n=2 Tax=Nocardioidaceae TaxID=85015 RepID=A0A6L6XV80_9ACTN|nr:phage terminase large subunit [Nocardioides sp. MAH-18]MBA2952125.1 phage terminase large subunit [Nocardioides sp. CGMCC 1.13656]MVQ51294.1 phage terminase large subunit [Nocardioides sp. MAH-18]